MGNPVIEGGWADVVSEWHRDYLASGHSPHSARSYGGHIKRFGRSVAERELADVTREDLVRFLDRPDWADETRHCARSAVRVFFAWASATGLVPFNVAVGLGAVDPAGLPGAWSESIADWRQWCTAAGRSQATLRIYTNYLQRFAHSVGERGPWDVTYDDLIGFLACDEWQPATRHSARSALRSFYQWAESTGRMNVDITIKLPSVAVPPGKPRPAPLDIVQTGLSRASTRNRLILLLEATAGLRRAETARVHRRDLVDGVLRVRGKGGKVRNVPLHNRELLNAIAAADGYLFPGGQNGHLSAEHVGKIAARMLGGGWTGHTLRHRFATKGYAAQRDLFAMQQLLGHAKPETTARYAEVPDGALDAACAAAAADFEVEEEAS